jgi:hypothetical protein
MAQCVGQEVGERGANKQQNCGFYGRCALTAPCYFQLSPPAFPKVLKNWFSRQTHWGMRTASFCPVPVSIFVTVYAQTPVLRSAVQEDALLRPLGRRDCKFKRSRDHRLESDGGWAMRLANFLPGAAARRACAGSLAVSQVLSARRRALRLTARPSG